jgi:cyclic pyranopterin phosphate synthase
MPEPGELSHTDSTGHVRMVDVSGKAATVRSALATAMVDVGPEVLERLTRADFDKGDVIATAKIAGIQAAKRTAELIPLCHGLSPDHVDLRISLVPPGLVRIESEARVTARTGVEMEAMVGATIAALTIYDMCKAVSKGITIGPVRLQRKSGGKSGEWTRDGNFSRSPASERDESPDP